MRSNKSVVVKKANKIKVVFALLSVYLIWGSTYLAIRIALESFPPFLMAGTRFLITGCGLYLFLRIKRIETPSRPQCLGAAAVGCLLLLGGNGGVSFAEQWVASGLAALGVAVTPILTVLFEGIWKRWPNRLEWIGLILGFIGVGLLNLESDMRATPMGAIALLIASLCWAFGSAWSRHLSLPSGLMASAVEMMAGGLFLLLVSLFLGEKLYGFPALPSLIAVLYLMIFGSLVGFSSYTYLLKNVRPTLATSYAYVNPVIAVGLGVGFAGERITATGFIAMIVILTAITLVMFEQGRS